jgi:UDP-glucose/GDP-mannose dehydrogenase family protein
VLGLAFKPGSDDIRDSPALEVAARIRALGARVAAFDPAAMDRARRVHPDLDYAGSVLGAARDADVLLLLTEWPEFSTADPQVLAKTVARRAVVDARHALDAAAWQACGWDYRAPGRPGTARTVAGSDGPGAGGSGTTDSGAGDAGDNGRTGTGDADRVRVDAERARVEVACLVAAS